jgi:hypothetical protein
LTADGGRACRLARRRWKRDGRCCHGREQRDAERRVDRDRRRLRQRRRRRAQLERGSIAAEGHEEGERPRCDPAAPPRHASFNERVRENLRSRIFFLARCQHASLRRLRRNQPESSKLWPPPPPPPPPPLRAGAGFGRGVLRGAGVGVLLAGTGRAVAARAGAEEAGLGARAAAAAARAAAALARARSLRTARRRRAARWLARSKAAARTRAELPTSAVATGPRSFGVLDSVWTKSPKPKWIEKARTIPTRMKTSSFDSRRVAISDGGAGASASVSSGTGRTASERAWGRSTGAGNERICGLVAKTLGSYVLVDAGSAIRRSNSMTGQAYLKKPDLALSNR